MSPGDLCNKRLPNWIVGGLGNRRLPNCMTGLKSIRVFVSKLHHELHISFRKALKLRHFSLQCVGLHIESHSYDVRLNDMNEGTQPLSRSATYCQEGWRSLFSNGRRACECDDTLRTWRECPNVPRRSGTRIGSGSYNRRGPFVVTFVPCEKELGLVRGLRLGRLIAFTRFS